MYSVLVEVSDKLILKNAPYIAAQWQGRCHPSGTESDRPSSQNVGKIYEGPVVAAAKKVNREEFPPFGSATAAKFLAMCHMKNRAVFPALGIVNILCRYNKRLAARMKGHCGRAVVQPQIGCNCLFQLSRLEPA